MNNLLNDEMNKWVNEWMRKISTPVPRQGTKWHKL